MPGPRLPREWLPYNRVVMRLRPSHADIIEDIEFPAAQAARVPAVPADVSRSLAGVARGYACWIEGGMPVIRPAFWDVDRGKVTIAPFSGRPRSGSPGALVVESHHRFRPSMMVGACVRGTFGGATDSSGIADRYGWDANAVRLVFVLSCLLPGPQFVVYLALWALMPKRPYPTAM